MTKELEIHAIKRRSLHRELVERIRPLFVSGQLVPGEKVPERELCTKFDVSRTPMREALKVLAVEGLVRLEPNRGAWVTAVTTSEVQEVFPILGALEALSGELACQFITDTEIQAVREMHESMLKSYRDKDLPSYFTINQNIHHAILLAAGNDTLTNYCDTLSTRMQRARYLANMTDERWAAAVDEHEKIIRTLEARDGKRLSAILLEHMKNKQDSVLRWLQSAKKSE